MAIRAALDTLLEHWWDVLPRLDAGQREAVLTQLRMLDQAPDELAGSTGADILAVVLPALPPEHPVTQAARQDEPRGPTTQTAPTQLFADLRALAGLASPTTTQELRRLDPDDLAFAAGLDPPWAPDTPVDPATAARLWHLSEILARIRRATGQDSLAQWFTQPAPRLANRAPRDLVADGDIQMLADLAAALEDFTVS